MGLVHRVVCLLTSGYASNKLYCLVTGAHRCERLAQSRYTAVPGRDWTHDLLIVNPTPYHCATHEKLDAQCDKQAKVVGWTWTVWQAGKHFDRWWLPALTASVHLCQAKLTTQTLQWTMSSGKIFQVQNYGTKFQREVSSFLKMAEFPYNSV